MATSEQVTRKLSQGILGIQRQGPGIPIEVLELRVPAVHPKLLVELDVRVSGELWRVSLQYGGPDAGLVSGNLHEVSMRTLELLVRTNLFEWWHTKDREAASARMGKRLA
ncbi:hypothetical protein V7793_00025 [Streptomyces sp. KLMMK]|uniref:hypothetical protein n=1 Tax=Streptomyces sp. KLMMK TaxID=3109353 RepID=UPI002FFF7C72